MSIFDLFHKLEAERKPPAGPPEWLIVGLGNPGSKYECTRHNAGFLALDTLAAKYGISVTRCKHHGLAGQGMIGDTSVLLLKPQTFMNRSGEAVSDAARFYKLPPERVLVLFDDVSLSVGRLRIRASGSAGGHNGIKDILLHLNSDKFPRIKLGVGGPPHPDYDLVDWVLGTFSAAERTTLSETIDRAVEAVPVLMKEGVAAAANRFN